MIVKIKIIVIMSNIVLNIYFEKYSHLLYCLQFKCCGVTSYEDWFDIKAWPGKKYVPDSCCQPEFENITGKNHLDLFI